MIDLSRTSIGHFNFFVLRTPLLPFDEFSAWSDDLDAPRAAPKDLPPALQSDLATLRARLRAWLKRGVVQEALALASPSLSDSVPVWEQDPDGKRGRRVERALVRYFTRMTSGCVPIGLLAGWSTGVVNGAPTSLRLSPASDWRRRVELESEVHRALTNALLEDSSVAAVARYRPAPSLRREGPKFHCGGGANEVAFPASDPVERLLRCAEDGVTLSTLQATATEALGTHAAHHARALVHELVKHGVLVCELDPTPVGDRPLDTLLARTIALGIVPPRTLQSLADGAKAVEQTRVDRPASYAAMLDVLERSAPAGAIRVDLHKPMADGVLGDEIISDIGGALDCLLQLSFLGTITDVTVLHQAFRRRFGEREVALLDVLDDCVGIGEHIKTNVTGGPGRGDFFDGAVGSTLEPELRECHATVERYLQEQVQLCALDRKTELCLGDEELSRRVALVPSRLTAAFMVPPAPVTAEVALAAASHDALRRGDYSVLFKSAYVGTVASLFSRAAHGDARLREYIELAHRQRSAVAGGVVFAEIVHEPHARANVVYRPPFSEYEIPLDRSTKPAAQQLALTDLTVTSDGAHLFLRSRRLGAIVVPCNTTAHFAFASSHKAYKFLSALQHFGRVAVVGWSWGRLAGCPFLPRVRYGRVLLQLAQWNLDRSQWTRVQEATTLESTFRAVQALRERWQWPRFIVAKEGRDDEHTFDLDNCLSVESLAHLLRGRARTCLVESYPRSDEIVVEGDGGRFHGDFYVPIRYGSLADRPPSLANRIRNAGRLELEDADHGGVGWLRCDIFAPLSMWQRILIEAVAPVVREHGDRLTRWSFVPELADAPRLQLVLCSDDAYLRERLVPAVQAALASLGDPRRVEALSIQSHDRQIATNGGTQAAAAISEALFHHDSVAAIAILDALGIATGDPAPFPSWRMRAATVGADALFDDFGIDLGARLSALRGLCDPLFTGERDARQLRALLSEAWRREYRGVGDVLGAGPDGGHLSGPLSALAERSVENREALSRLGPIERRGGLLVERETLAAHHVRLFWKRLLFWKDEQLVAAEVMRRAYTSRLARAGSLT